MTNLQKFALGMSFAIFGNFTIFLEMSFAPIGQKSLLIVHTAQNRTHWGLFVHNY